VNGTLLPALVWGAAAVLAFGYAGLFLWARRPVAIRLIRVGVVCTIVLALRLALLAVGNSTVMEWEIAVGSSALAVGLSCLLARRVWLVRASIEEFRAVVADGCSGLFIAWQESKPGCFVLSAKEGIWQTRLVRLSTRMQFAVVRPPVGQGKLALFVLWLSKQYPGPVPKIHIVLHRSQP
jgi:hypothetical protein